MSPAQLITQRKFKWYCWIQNLVTSISFSLVALGLGYFVLSSGGNPNLVLAAPFAAGGAFFSSLILWPKDFGERISFTKGALSGLLIGLLSHPLMFLIYMPFLLISDNALDQGTVLGNVKAFIEGSIGLILLGTFCSLIGVGWLTALVGGITGFLIVSVIRAVENQGISRTEEKNRELTLSLEEHNHPDHLTKIKLEQTKRRLYGSLTALFVIALVTGPVTYLLADSYAQSIEQQPVIIEKPAAPWE